MMSYGDDCVVRGDNGRVEGGEEVGAGKCDE